MRRVLLSLFAITAFAVPGQDVPSMRAASVLGQVIGNSVTVDGMRVPYGTTIFEGSRVGTESYPAAVQLSNGQVVTLARNSSALFERRETGEIRARVESGTLSFRKSGGSVSTVSSDYEVVFTQRREGLPVGNSEEGLVAVIAPATDRAGNRQERADSGQRRVPVNDSARIEPTIELLLRTSASRVAPPVTQFVQEVKCGIDYIEDNIVALSQDLTFTHQPDDLVIQRASVDESRAYTELSEGATNGTDTLFVVDSKAVNPLERIIVQSFDQKYREVACVEHTFEDWTVDADASTQRSRIKIANGLLHDYDRRSNDGRWADIVQGERFSGPEQVVASLAEDVEAGDREFIVENASQIDPLQQLLIRSGEGARLEAYCIYSVERIDPFDSFQDPGRVRLSEGLDMSYPVATELWQGRSSQELIASGVAVQRLANCCCCCEGFLALGAFIPPSRVNPLWFLLGGAAGAGAGIAAGGGGGGGVTTPPAEPPSSPVTP